MGPRAPLPDPASGRAVPPLSVPSKLLYGRWMGVASEREAAFDLGGAAEAYGRAYAHAPGRRERAVALARVSKQYSDLSWQTFATLTGRDFHPGASPRPAATMELGLQHAKRASELAQEAFDIFPDDGLVRVGVCANLGRQALFSDPRTMVRLSDRVKSLAEAAVAAEPGYDFGWHTVGRWHYAMADLPLPVKCIVKYYYRGEVFSASFAAARDAHSRAKELNPRNLNHRVELAKSLAKLGRPREAQEELRGALDLPTEDLNDWVTRKQGQRLLAELEASPRVLEGGRGPQPAA